MNIFISGSISINKLPKSAIQKIENIIRKNYTILIGDARGVDFHTQKYLLKNNYDNVLVYFAGEKIRNNVGNWKTKNIKAFSNEKGRDLYTLKDKAMAHDADYGLMIWDGESQGTLNNILTMKSENKKFFVVLEEMLVDSEHIDPIVDVYYKQNKKVDSMIYSNNAGDLHTFPASPNGFTIQDSCSICIPTKFSA